MVYHADAFYQHVPSAYYRSFLQILRPICSHIRLDGPGVGGGAEKKRFMISTAATVSLQGNSLELSSQHGTAQEQTLLLQREH